MASGSNVDVLAARRARLIYEFERTTFEVAICRRERPYRADRCWDGGGGKKSTWLKLARLEGVRQVSRTGQILADGEDVVHCGKVAHGIMPRRKAWKHGANGLFIPAI